MCGIVGYTGPKPALPFLLEGLAKLEYRGYDSAGIALASPSSDTLRIIKKAGKIGRLSAAVRSARLPASWTAGIGHTRWATHGPPTDANAHPHSGCRGRVAIVHNGILENFQELKKRLKARGHTFRSQTDSEVIAHLLEEELSKAPWRTAFRKALSRVRGAYSVVGTYSGEPGTLLGARYGGGALVVGLGEGENFLASDVPALLRHTQKVQYLEDGEMVEITPGGVRILRLRDGSKVSRKASEIEWTAEQAAKGGHAHFMLKEILEQPRALEATFAGRLDARRGEVTLEGEFWSSPFLKRFRRVVFLAMGTSYYAALVGKFLFEKILRVPVEVDNASEFRYRDPVVDGKTLAVVITQIGETVDTLVALREARARGAKAVAICNVMGSSATREADGFLLTRAGPEIGVASTKAFTTQLGALWLMALKLGRARRSLSRPAAVRMAGSLSRMPSLIAGQLRQRSAVDRIARRYARYFNFLFIGRGIQYPIALEGALKLKEISYIHAEGYPGGELKHGPIALIDARMPVVAIALRSSAVYDKILANMEEVKARGARLIALVEKGDRAVLNLADEILELPVVGEELAPLLSVIPLQLLAYGIAKKRKREIDQPRNLAKSVTVE
jgi:glucosamine--fructose-6-phosphate aminotransferase (isomerizing)